MRGGMGADIVILERGGIFRSNRQSTKQLSLPFDIDHGASWSGFGILVFILAWFLIGISWLTIVPPRSKSGEWELFFASAGIALLCAIAWSWFATPLLNRRAPKRKAARVTVDGFYMTGERGELLLVSWHDVLALRTVCGEHLTRLIAKLKQPRQHGVAPSARSRENEHEIVLPTNCFALSEATMHTIFKTMVQRAGGRIG